MLIHHLHALETLLCTFFLILLSTSLVLNVAAVSLSETIRVGPKTGAMNPGPVQPIQNPLKGDTDSSDTGSLTISDVLPKSRNINIFASLTRDVSSISARLGSTKPTDNTTLLAPLNSVMQNLPRKPWEDRPNDDSDIKAARNEDKAAQNLERFVTEHVVPSSPWKPGREHGVKTLGGQELWWEESGGQRIIRPGDVVVDSVVGQVGNGEIWALRGVINYS